MEIKKEKVKKKVCFVANVKMPIEAGVFCTIDGYTFFVHKNTWLGDSGASCHITNDDTHLFLCHQHQQDDPRKLWKHASYKKGKALIQCLTS